MASKWSTAAILKNYGLEIRQMNYIRTHSHHITSKGVSAPNETTNQAALQQAAMRARMNEMTRNRQSGRYETIRVLRFD